jgi:hypothetical protein
MRFASLTNLAGMLDPFDITGYMTSRGANGGVQTADNAPYATVRPVQSRIGQPVGFIQHYSEQPYCILKAFAKRHPFAELLGISRAGMRRCIKCGQRDSVFAAIMTSEITSHSLLIYKSTCKPLWSWKNIWLPTVRQEIIAAITIAATLDCLARSQRAVGWRDELGLCLE